MKLLDKSREKIQMRWSSFLPFEMNVIKSIFASYTETTTSAWKNAYSDGTTNTFSRFCSSGITVFKLVAHGDVVLGAAVLDLALVSDFLPISFRHIYLKQMVCAVLEFCFCTRLFCWFKSTNFWRISSYVRSNSWQGDKKLTKLKVRGANDVEVKSVLRHEFKGCNDRSRYTPHLTSRIFLSPGDGNFTNCGSIILPAVGFQSKSNGQRCSEGWIMQKITNSTHHLGFLLLESVDQDNFKVKVDGSSLKVDVPGTVDVGKLYESLKKMSSSVKIESVVPVCAKCRDFN